jgi:hypothetical protein
LDNLEAAHKTKDSSWTKAVDEVWAKPIVKEVATLAAAAVVVELAARYGGRVLEDSAPVAEAAVAAVKRVEPEGGMLTAKLEKLGIGGIGNASTSVAVEVEEVGSISARTAQDAIAASRVMESKSIAQLSGEESIGTVNTGEPESVVQRLRQIGSRDGATKIAAPEVATEEIAKPAIVRVDGNRIDAVMNKPQNVLALTDKLVAGTRTWGNIMPLRDKAIKAELSYYSAVEKAEARIQSKGFDFNPYNLSNKQLTALRDFPGLEGTRGSIGTVIRRKEVSLARDQDLHQELSKRARDLTSGMQSFSRAHEIPSPTVKISALQKRTGGVYSENNVILNSDSVIEKARNPMAIETSVHEFTHHDQLLAVVMRKADLMGIKTSASPEEIRIINDSTGFNSTEKQVERILNLRAGRRLSTEAEERADRIAESKQTMNKIIKPGTLDEFRDWHDTIASQSAHENVATLFGPDGGRMAAALAIDFEHSARANEVVSSFAPAFDKLGNWSMAFNKRIGQQIEEQLQKSRILVDMAENKYDRAYGSAFYENEAWNNGNLSLEHIFSSK